MKENFLRFMTSSKGRASRVFLGLILLSLGMLVIQGTIGSILTIVALIPIAGGLFDFCLAGALMGYPLSGAKVRNMLTGRRNFRSKKSSST